MAVVYTDDQNYKDIAAAIRSRNGTEDSYTPSEMAGAIEALTGEEGSFRVVTVQNRAADSTGNIGFPDTPETDTDLVTKKWVADLIAQQIAQVKTAIIDSVCRVGKILITQDATNPSEYLGGTWEQVKDKFILAAGDVYAAGSTGGEAEHTLTVDESPGHTHDRGTMEITGSVRTSWGDSSGGGIILNQASGAFAYHREGTAYWNTASNNSTTHNNCLDFKASESWTGETSSVGGGQPHNNMPPYETFYIWKRIA